jgi:hypothetical protein
VNSLKFKLGHRCGQLGPVARTYLLEDVRHVALDGLARYEQLLGDLSVAGARCNQARDSPLTVGQRLGAGAASPGAHAERSKSTSGELCHGSCAELVGDDSRAFELLGRLFVAGVGQRKSAVEPHPERSEAEWRALDIREHGLEPCGSNRGIILSERVRVGARENVVLLRSSSMTLSTATSVPPGSVEVLRAVRIWMGDRRPHTHSAA